MNTALIRQEVQQFILQNLEKDPHALALKKSPFEDVTMSQIAGQVAARRQIKSKLPSLYTAPGLVFPPKLNLEQSSSEKTANYKANLLKGSTLLDLTGGFGIDDMAFAENFEKVTYCEHNAELANIAAHNFKALGKDNIEVHSGNGIELLDNRQWDIIYCDPDRRITAKRAYRLEDCEPNMVELEDKVLAHCDSLWIKASPMLDIAQAKSSLKHLNKILVVAVKGEVKELLLCCKAESKKPIECAINLFDKQVLKDRIETDFEEINYEEPANYLYLAHGALMKLQAYGYIAHKYGVSKLAPSSHIFTWEGFKSFRGKYMTAECLNWRPAVIYLPRKLLNPSQGVALRYWPCTTTTNEA